MTFPNGTVVVGIDGSPASRAAVEWARSAARTSGSHLQLVAVYEGETPQPHVQRAVQEARAGKSADECEVVVTHGDPVEVLLLQAEGAELLVVGRHGVGGMIHSALGSVGDACARRASCPVVIVPPPATG
jgi:nucleotide-binding universal stress UspA family protein